MNTKNVFPLLEKKLRVSPDSKQKAIDKDIYNILVLMENRITVLEKRLEEYESKESED